MSVRHRQNEAIDARGGSDRADEYETGEQWLHPHQGERRPGKRAADPAERLRSRSVGNRVELGDVFRLNAEVQRVVNEIVVRAKATLLRPSLGLSWCQVWKNNF